MNDPATKRDGTVRGDPEPGSPFFSEYKYAFSRDRDEITGRVEVFRARDKHGRFTPDSEWIFRVSKN